MAKKYSKLSVNIPALLDEEKLFKNIVESIISSSKKYTWEAPPSDKVIQKVKEATYLFLHMLYPNDKYKKKYIISNYWRPILSKEFNDLTGKLFTLVKTILTNSDYPIISIKKGYLVGSYSKSYRLNDEFWIDGCPAKKIEIESIISEKYLEKVILDPIDDSNLEKNFDYLLKNYNKKTITLNSNVFNYVEKFEKLLTEKFKGLRSPKKIEFLEKKCKNKINKLNRHIENINNGDFNAKFSSNTRRLSSELSYCNKEIRNYIKINGNSNIVNIDLISSHIKLFTSILNNNFMLNNENKFSLYKINKKYYNILSNGLKPSRFMRKLTYNKVHNDPSIDLTSYSDSMLLYMCGTFNNSDVNEFKNLQNEDCIYSYLNNVLFDGTKDRDYIKDNVMKFLNMKKFRDSNLLVSVMSRKYPTTDDVIDIFNNHMSGKGNLSTLLQCTEAYLILEVGIKSVLKKLPELRFITIHDSIMVEEVYAEQVREILTDAISKVTEYQVAFSLEKIMDPIDSIQETVDQSWKDMLSAYEKHLKGKRSKIKKVS